MSWEKEKISDHCEITSSKRIFYSEYVKTGVPFYRSKEIIEMSQGQSISEPLYIRLEKYREIKEKFGAPEVDDMLLTSVGTIGIPYIVKHDDCFYFKDGNLTWFRNFDDKLLSRYLYYWICSAEGHGVLNNTTIGSSQKALTISALKSVAISLPSIEAQRKVVDILSAYDDLIQNNQKQIKLLEEAAQRLYEEWFIDLRFPDHGETVSIDGVPNEWQRIPLQEVIGYEIGGGWGSETPTKDCEMSAFVIRGTDLFGLTHGDFAEIPYRFHGKSNLEARQLIDGDIIFEVSGGSKTEGVARTALIRQSFLDTFKSPVMCASFCKLIRVGHKEQAQYLYDTLQYLRRSGKTVEFDKRSASSIVNYRWKDFLQQQEIWIPKQSVLAQYTKLAENIYQKILACSKQIMQIKKARDRLLPKLMSGELEVITHNEETMQADRFKYIRKHWQDVPYNADLPLAARRTGDISEETLGKLKQIAEEE